MEYLCSIRIDIPGMSSIKIRNLLVRSIEASSNRRQFDVEVIRHGGYLRTRYNRRTKKEVVELFINKQVNKCYKEFVRFHGLEKRHTLKASNYKEKKGSFIEEFLINFPVDITSTLAICFLTYLAEKLKKEFEKLIKNNKDREKDNKNREQPPVGNNNSTVQVNIRNLNVGQLNMGDIIISK